VKNAVFWDVTLVRLLRKSISEERIGSVIRVEKIRELRTIEVLATEAHCEETPTIS
jgi:hypothetical protein